MAITAHVYQLYIAASPEQVWAAITESEWTRRYFHSTSFIGPLQADRPYGTVLPDGSPAVDGLIEVLTPPGPDTPGRLVQTWHIAYDDALAAEPPGRVEWTVEAAGDGLTRVRLVHGDLAESPLTWAHVREGWVWVLDSLKSVLETGSPLPAAARETSTTTPPAEGDWHRRQGVEANNTAWELLDHPERTGADDDELLRTAYAAAYHWDRAAGRGPENAARADYLISRALLATGEPTAALRSADRCLAGCTEHDLADFDLAYAHEARARALGALGREPEAAVEWAAADAVEVADPEDRRLVERDLATR